MNKTVHVILFVMLFLPGRAGEELTGFNANPALSVKLNKQYQLQQQQQRGTALSLPFFDDFYQAGAYPEASRWADNFVFVNPSFPSDPVSIGVATFDGLDETGSAYNDLPTASGFADKLTSQPIDLSGLTKDSSVFLSFYYQAGGIGEMPELNQDYLTVEFLRPDSVWIKMWQFTPDSVRPFKQVFIAVDTPFLYDQFQFRFYAIGNLAGMNDVWHVDYVKLDKHRDSSVESNIKEMAFQYPAQSLLDPFYSIPYNQYDTLDLRDTVRVFVRNNFINPTTDIVDDYEATLLNDGSTLATFSGPSRDYGPDTRNEIAYPEFNIPAATYAGDTLTVQVKYNFVVSAEAGSAPGVLANNTIYRNQLFSNFMAYDDGSPERGYWVTGVDGYKLAVKYSLRHADTLQAVKMQFTPVQSNINQALFSVVVWKAITLGTATDEVIYQEDFLTISDLVQEYGYDTINGYFYYNFKEDYVKDGTDFPLFMTDSFYVGLLVTNRNSLTVGFDRNNDASAYNFYYDGIRWYQSGFSGGMIIDPILGKRLPDYLTPVIQHQHDYKVQIYPNPVRDHLYLSGVRENSRVDIYDLGGRVLKSFEVNNDRLIGVSELPAGTYVLSITDTKTRAYGAIKFLKLD